MTNMTNQGSRNGGSIFATCKLKTISQEEGEMEFTMTMLISGPAYYFYKGPGSFRVLDTVS